MYYVGTVDLHGPVLVGRAVIRAVYVEGRKDGQIWAPM